MDNERPNLDDDARMEEILKKMDAEEAAKASAENTEGQVSAPTSEETAPVETPASGEETGHSEPAPPAIEPPKFLKAEYRDKWKDLSPDWRDYWTAHEEETRRLTSEKFNEAAEQRRKAEAAERAATEKANAIATEQQRYAQAVAQYADRLEQLDPIIAGYNRLAKEGKLVELARSNPDQYAELDAAYKSRMQELQAARQEQQRTQQELMTAHFQKEEQAIREKIPEWADTKVGKEGIDNLRSFAVKNYGFRQDEVQTIADHRYVLMARDAARYHELKAQVDANEKKAAEEAAQRKAALEAKKVAPKPAKVVVPTASGDLAGKTEAERNRALIQKSKTVRSISDKAAILADLI